MNCEVSSMTPKNLQPNKTGQVLKVGTSASKSISKVVGKSPGMVVKSNKAEEEKWDDDDDCYSSASTSVTSLDDSFV